MNVDLTELGVEELVALKRKVTLELRNRYKAEADADPYVYAVRRRWFYGGSIRDPKARWCHSHRTADIGWGGWMDNNLTHSALHFYTKREAEALVEMYQEHDRIRGEKKFTYSTVPLLKDHPAVLNAKPELYRS